ncbi:uncharacterized protein B0T15DRAFT_492975 [Chaetomium strumarium]|uniref:Uncharacterized protein n=1 Tax=Chaetomium strumarium TaxID=1170767 RepID=A0AAJ0GWW3_9PEZI|nr:hypothetical protein B0T15DRAFT_492975 [Chaetomium strumarium]
MGKRDWLILAPLAVLYLGVLYYMTLHGRLPLFGASGLFPLDDNPSSYGEEVLMQIAKGFEVYASSVVEAESENRLLEMLGTAHGVIGDERDLDT